MGDGWVGRLLLKTPVGATARHLGYEAIIEGEAKPSPGRASLPWKGPNESADKPPYLQSPRRADGRRRRDLGH